MVCRQTTTGQWNGQYLTIPYTERLAEAGIESSARSVGDSCDNAFAEMIGGLSKTELVHPLPGRRCLHRREGPGPGRNMQDLETANLGWVDGFINGRLLGPIGNIPPAEAVQNFYAQGDTLDMVA